MFTRKLNGLNLLITVVVITGLMTVSLIKAEAGSQGDSLRGFLKVRGNKIINKDNIEVKLKGFVCTDTLYAPANTFPNYKNLRETPVNKFPDFVPVLTKGNTDTAILNFYKNYVFTEDDIDRIKDLGANSVRIKLRLWEFERTPFQYNSEVLARLDSLIASFGRRQIYVILDLQVCGQNFTSSNREYGYKLWDKHGAALPFQNRCVEFWKMISNRYKRNAVIAGYDLINEPHPLIKKEYRKFVQKMIDGIRLNDNNHIIFVSESLKMPKEAIKTFFNNIAQDDDIGFGDSPEDPYTDSNLAYTLHFYSPREVSHQQPVDKIHPYPGTYFSRCVNSGQTQWDYNHIELCFDQFVEKANAYNRPLWIGEFGARIWDQKTNQPETTWGTHQYLDDVFNIINQKGLNYTFFTYKSGWAFSLGYYQPDEALGAKIKKIQRNIKNGTTSFSDLTIDEMSNYKTENFRFSPKLRDILVK